MEENQSFSNSPSNGQEPHVAGINYAIPPDFLYLGSFVDFETIAEDTFPLLIPEWEELLSFGNSDENFFLAFFGDVIIGSFEEYLMISYSPEWLNQIIQEELFMEIVNQKQLFQQDDPMPLFDLLLRYSDYLKKIQNDKLHPIWLLFETNSSLPYF